MGKGQIALAIYLITSCIVIATAYFLLSRTPRSRFKLLSYSVLVGGLLGIGFNYVIPVPFAGSMIVAILTGSLGMPGEFFVFGVLIPSLINFSIGWTISWLTFHDKIVFILLGISLTGLLAIIWACWLHFWGTF